MDLATYMTRFQWDMAKYPIKQSLKNLSDMIAKQVGTIAIKMFKKFSSTENLDTYIQNLEYFCLLFKWL